MRNRNTSIDGFVSRRTRPSTDGVAGARAAVKPAQAARTPQAAPISARQSSRPRVGVNRSEIDDSLKEIDAPERDRKGRVKKTRAQKARRKKIIKRCIVAVLLVVVLIGGYVGVKALIASSKAFQGSLFDFVQKTPLKTDANGRSNILVVGTSEDGDDGNHPGGDLTDSIMVVSVNQEKQDAYMVSMPRDFWVKLDQPCDVGYEAKINTVFMCNAEGGQNEAAGMAALQSKVGEVFGLDLQYYVHVNNSVLEDAVDAVGGIEVLVESDDPRGIYDPNFDWQCNHQCRMVDYANGEVAQMDGAHALAFARARNAQGGYGLSGGNFDREKNQQKVIRALQEKAVSAGTLTSVSKVTGLIDAFGDNLRTNFEVKELRTLADLGQGIRGDNIQSINLAEEGNMVVTTGNYGGQSIVQPVDGMYIYSGIHTYINRQINSDAVTRENAEVAVLNGSGVMGAAQVEADKIEARGMMIGLIDNAPEGEYGKATLYQIGEGNPATKSRLEKMYGIKVTAGDPPVLVSSTTDFVLVVGTAADTSSLQ